MPGFEHQKQPDLNGTSKEKDKLWCERYRPSLESYGLHHSRLLVIGSSYLSKQDLTNSSVTRNLCF